jgi:transcriptional regulator with XRE-family HTH domain
MLTKFGKALDQMIEKRGMTNRQLAEAIGSNPQFVSNLKRAKRPHYRTLRKLALALNVEERELEILTS